jgi:hypothetical protein
MGYVFSQRDRRQQQQVQRGLGKTRIFVRIQKKKKKKKSPIDQSSPNCLSPIPALSQSAKS